MLSATPTTIPRLSAIEPAPRASLRAAPEDFVVEELPAYAPTGIGEHLFVTFRKTGRTTIEAVRRIAEALGVDPREAGFAGMKDKHAVTTQTASFFVGRDADADARLANAGLGDAAGIEILGVRRHGHKLKPGHLAGNRFVIVLRDVTDVTAVETRLAAIGREGVPNAFGPQRFGRDGDNPERALAWLAGRERGPRDRREQRLLFSSLQSLLYNAVLARRVVDGSWRRVMPGDLVKKHDTGGLFLAPLEAGSELDEVQGRAEAGAVSPTGPMFGVKMRWPEGPAQALEAAVLAESGVGESDLERFRNLGEGTRRALRIMPQDVRTEREPGNGSALRISFILPKGAYATTVLAQACELADVSGCRDRERSERPPE